MYYYAEYFKSSDKPRAYIGILFVIKKSNLVDSYSLQKLKAAPIGLSLIIIINSLLPKFLVIRLIIFINSEDIQTLNQQLIINKGISM